MQLPSLAPDIDAEIRAAIKEAYAKRMCISNHVSWLQDEARAGPPLYVPPMPVPHHAGRAVGGVYHDPLPLARQFGAKLGEGVFKAAMLGSETSDGRRGLLRDPRIVSWEPESGPPRDWVRTLSAAVASARAGSDSLCFILYPPGSIRTLYGRTDNGLPLMFQVRELHGNVLEMPLRGLADDELFVAAIDPSTIIARSREPSAVPSIGGPIAELGRVTYRLSAALTFELGDPESIVRIDTTHLPKIRISEKRNGEQDGSADRSASPGGG